MRFTLLGFNKSWPCREGGSTGSLIIPCWKRSAEYADKG